MVLNCSVKRHLVRMKSRTPSNDSVYDLVDEWNDDPCNANNMNVDAKISTRTKGSDSSFPDELFEVIDDDSDDLQERKNSDNIKAVRERCKSSSDDDFDMDRIIEEFAKEGSEENEIITFSDEDELDSIVQEFVKTHSSSQEDSQKPDVYSQSSEGDSEMDIIVKEFAKVDSLDMENDVQKRDLNVQSSEGDEEMDSLVKEFAESRSSPIEQDMQKTDLSNNSSEGDENMAMNELDSEQSSPKEDAQKSNLNSPTSEKDNDITSLLEGFNDESDSDDGFSILNVDSRDENIPKENESSETDVGKKEVDKNIKPFQLEIDMSEGCLKNVQISEIKANNISTELHTTEILVKNNVSVEMQTAVNFTENSEVKESFILDTNVCNKLQSTVATCNNSVLGQDAFTLNNNKIDENDKLVNSSESFIAETTCPSVDEIKEFNREESGNVSFNNQMTSERLNVSDSVKATDKIIKNNSLISDGIKSETVAKCMSKVVEDNVLPDIPVFTKSETTVNKNLKYNSLNDSLQVYDNANTISNCDNMYRISNMKVENKLLEDCISVLNSLLVETELLCNMGNGGMICTNVAPFIKMKTEEDQTLIVHNVLEEILSEVCSFINTSCIEPTSEYKNVHDLSSSENLRIDRGVTHLKEVRKRELSEDKIADVEVKKIKFEPALKTSTDENSTSSCTDSVTDACKNEREMNSFNHAVIVSSTESKKRKIDELEDNLDINFKKLKDEELVNRTRLNGLTTKEDLLSNKLDCSDIEVDNSKDEIAVKENISYKQKPSKRKNSYFITSLILKEMCKCEIVNDILKRRHKEYASEKKKVEELEQKLQRLQENTEKTRLLVTEFYEQQQHLFKENNYTAKVRTRTVGANMKTYLGKHSQDLHKASGDFAAESMTVSSVPQIANTCTRRTDTQNDNAVLSTPKKTYVISPHGRAELNKINSSSVPEKSISTLASPTAQEKRVQNHAVQQNLARVTPVSRMPSPGNRSASPATQRFISPATRPANKMVSIINKTSVPSTNMNHPVVFIPPNNAASSAGTSSSSTPSSSAKGNNQIIDLTEDGAPSPATTLASSSTLTKITLPVTSNNQNVMVPISTLQLLPNATQSGSQVPITRSAQIQRPPVINPLPSGMISGRTITYFVPSGSAPLGLAPVNSRQVSPFLSTSNQRLQFVVRVTNPTAVAPLSNAVTTRARIPVQTTSRMSFSNPVRIPQSRIVTSSQSRLMSLPNLTVTQSSVNTSSQHPAPFPQTPHYPLGGKLKALPPKPSLKGSKAPNGIILSWNMRVLNSHADISTYQLFAYQEGSGPVTASLWKKVGDIKALPLPMACTLTQFHEGHRYYFTVRAVDVYTRFGPFSDPVSIMYGPKSNESPTNK